MRPHEIHNPVELVLISLQHLWKARRGSPGTHRKDRREEWTGPSLSGAGPEHSRPSYSRKPCGAQVGPTYWSPTSLEALAELAVESKWKSGQREDNPTDALTDPCLITTLRPKDLELTEGAADTGGSLATQKPRTTTTDIGPPRLCQWHGPWGLSTIRRRQQRVEGDHSARFASLWDWNGADPVARSDHYTPVPQASNANREKPYYGYLTTA
ncbi:hypothetical protein NDU88_007126 [Pleurodeles waltl]|uniref:Uncharacterized protein n=1 Tax=Pleurodeles waltl TaxID=8319 RepID=A0AAV7PKC0_PLEWA|nr:hypothetical protein NDU88_007126 [Pleurodeles waltl]